MQAVGHKSGRHIVEILRKAEGDYTDEDVAHMRVSALGTSHISECRLSVTGLSWSVCCASAGRSLRQLPAGWLCPRAQKVVGYVHRHMAQRSHVSDEKVEHR
jgi:hypothetical protein